MIQQGMCTQFKRSAFFNRTYFVALFRGANLTLDLNFEESGFPAGEITATNYISGGEPVYYTEAGIQVTSTAAYVTFDPVTWNSPDIVADAALLYDISKGVPVAILDFGGDRASVGGVFTITFPPLDPVNAFLKIE